MQRIREEPADDADDAPPGPVGALDADDLELFEVGEVVAVGGGGEIGEAVVPLLPVGRVEERGAGFDREVGAQHHHGELAGALRERHGRRASRRLAVDPRAGHPPPTKTRPMEKTANSAQQ
uniref:DUF834 domain-containing protein n=1 Tax=Oryza punctata TaxID=4537 RepID=A0A0E0JTK5_ORYPU